VNVVNKRVIGYLEDDVFTTLSELNTAIEERVAEINHDIRRADGTTRWERFDTEGGSCSARYRTPALKTSSGKS
jgi:hypothetical protein